MQIIVQEGNAIISLAQEVQAHDDSLRSITIKEMSEPVKVFYRDYEMIRVEVRDGAIEVLPSSVASIFWIEKGRRYQLKTGV
jgi:hypothetical protein